MLLTAKDLSRQLKIKPSTLYAWAAQGKVPCLKINGVVRFDAEEVERWLKSCRVRKEQSLPARKDQRIEVDTLIERAKREVYTPRHGETRPTSSPKGKEGENGAR